jgi:hypothetical protein
MPSRQHSLRLPRATPELAKLVQWHGDKDHQTAGSRGRGRTMIMLTRTVPSPAVMAI